MKSYTCKTCGAELIVNDNTTFTNCLYCGNNIAITQKEFGDLNIKKIIPFSIDKEKAINSYKKVVKGEIIDAKKVYVPVRFCNFDFDFLFYYQYEQESTDSNGNTTTTYIDTEELLDGTVENEIVFGDSKISYVNMPYEIRNCERFNFDPVLLKDVSIEKAAFEENEEFKRNLEEDVRFFSRKKFSNVTRIYSENYFVSGIELDSYSTLIPIYIIKTSNGRIYNLPGVEPNKFKKMKKGNDIVKILCLIVAILLALFATMNRLYFLYLFADIAFAIFLLKSFSKSKYLNAKGNDNYSYKRYSFGNNRKKIKY